jgi:NAD(P)-dependent dehydrogenase (short-subunit alcohol dehydrogenase family)
MGATDYTPKTGVIITGGGSGIGEATALALAEAERPVAIWDVNGEAAQRVAKDVSERFGVQACGVAIDVQDTAAFAYAIAQSRDAMGSIGALVHGAGVAGVSPISELDDVVWDTVQHIHLKAAALLIRDLVPDLTGNPGSAVVVISSIEGLVASAAVPAYCSAKAGLLGLARSTAVGLAGRGVRANAVCPGYVDTPMLRPAFSQPGLLEACEARIPLQRLGRPEDIARTIRFLLSDDAAYITAAEIVIDGGVTKADPLGNIGVSRASPGSRR